ncbi:MAG: MFS transporter, partial [Dehalococcoidia bacterium]
VVPLFLVEVNGRGVYQVGGVLAAMSLQVVLHTPLGGRLSDRWGRRWPALAGSALVLMGLAPFLAVDVSWNLGVVAVLLAIVGAGMALQLPAIQTAAVESAPERDAGMASGVFSLGRYVGSIVGAALLAAIIGSGVAGGDAVSINAVSTVFVVAVVAASGALITPFWLSRR